MPSRNRRDAEDEGEDITVDEAPTSIDPYAILSLDKEATRNEINTAYRKAALKCHPDKVAAEDKDSAHAKFQEVAFAYAILSDDRRRQRYDTTGRTEESLDLEDDDFDWTDFFRHQYKDVVTVDKINDFARGYKGGEEEREHVLQAYGKTKGNMDKLYNEVMLSDVLEDDERFRAIIDAAIEAGDVEDFTAYSQETEKKRKARFTRAKQKKAKEAKELAEAQEEEEAEKAGAKGKASKKKSAGAAESDLAALIQARQQSRQGRQESFFDRLEAKYAPKGKKRGSDDAPSEEAFAANRKVGKEGDAKAGAGSGRSKRAKKAQVKEQQQHRPYYYNGNHQANAPPLLAQLALATPGVLVSVIVSTTFCVLVAPTVVTAFHFVSHTYYRKHPLQALLKYRPRRFPFTQPWHVSQGLAMQFVESPEQIMMPGLAAYQRTCENYKAFERSSQAVYIKDDSGL